MQQSCKSKKDMIPLLAYKKLIRFEDDAFLC